MAWKRTIFGGRLTIKSDRWPWDAKVFGNGEKYGWGQPPGMGRFGGGWNWELGFQSGGWKKEYGISVTFNLLYGFVCLTYHSKAYRAKNAREEAAKRAAEAAKKEPAPIAASFPFTPASDDIPF